MKPRFGSPSSAQSKVSEPAAARCAARIPDAHALVRDDELRRQSSAKSPHSSQHALRGAAQGEHAQVPDPAAAPPAPIAPPSRARRRVADRGPHPRARLRASASAAMTRADDAARRRPRRRSRGSSSALGSARRAQAWESGPAAPVRQRRQRRLRRRQQIERQESQIAQPPHRPPRARKQPHQPIGEGDDLAPVRRAPCIVGRGQRPGARARRACSATSSARLATSRSPRLKPMPATGCSPCAALPTMTQRPALVARARRQRQWISEAPAHLEEPAQPEAEPRAALRPGIARPDQPMRRSATPGVNVRRACSGRRRAAAKRAGPMR